MNCRLNMYKNRINASFFFYQKRLRHEFLPLITIFLSSICRERRKDQTNKIQEDLTAERTVENKLM